MSYLKRLVTRRVPQWAPIPGSGQVPNSAGGFAWAVDDWTRLRRFLILGSEGGSYYASEWKLTRENAQARRALPGRGRPAGGRRDRPRQRRGPRAEERPGDLRARDGGRPRRRADAQGRARGAAAGVPHGHAPVPVRDVRRGLPRLGPLAAARGRPLVRRAAGRRARLPGGQVPPARGRDAPRPAAAGAPGARGERAATRRSSVSDEHARLFEWIVRGGETDGLPRVVEGFVRAQAAATPAETAALVREYGLPREAVPSEHLTAPEVWEALLEDMPMTAHDPQPRDDDARRRARAGLGRHGEGGRAARRRASGIRRARVHPIAVLAALRTYASGRGARGRHEWNPVREVVDALDAAFYAAFGNVEPAGKRLLLALDVSGSMTCGCVAGVPGLTPRDASAALALVTAATEPRYEIVGFFAGRRGWKSGRKRRSGASASDGLTPLAISPRQRLDDVVKTVSDLPFGGTDCALPMLYAQAQEREVDTFVIYTDSETWAGDVHPAQALRGLPPGVGHRRAAGRGRHGLERLLDRRSRATRACSTSSASTRRRRS